MVSNELEGGMFCAVCQKYGKPPAQARGAWFTHPISNWSKAVELINKHEKSEWHLASAEAQAMDESARMQGRGIVELIVVAIGEEKRKNCEIIRQLIT